MKKIFAKYVLLTLFLLCFSGLYISTAEASVVTTPTPTVTPTPTITPPVVEKFSYQIAITKMPSKTVYSKGDKLNFSDMVVESYYTDGTSAVITDYSIQNYFPDQIGPQTVFISYQNQMAILQIMVVPATVKNITTTYHDTLTLTLSWDAIPGALRYEIYEQDAATGFFNLASVSDINSITLSAMAGTVHKYQICVVEMSGGYEYRGPMSDTYTTATNPEAVTGLVVTGTSTNSISLSWNAVANATGYQIYRSNASENKYTLIGTSATPSFVSDKLSSGKSYNYKVCAFSINESYTGGYSNVVDTSTNPAKVSLKFKTGEQKIRLTWTGVTGATAYDVYFGDAVKGYTLITTQKGGSSSYTYLVEGLTLGNTYSFYAVARRDYNGISYNSVTYDIQTTLISLLEPTSVIGKLFPLKKDFLNSVAYQTIPFFKKYINYSKSYAIPGLVTTNVGGFSSTTMCPQGLTFAENYVLMSAYDLTGVENSVIYVMDKNTKALLSTLVLPSKPHLGGLAYDGVNLWLTTGSKLSAIPYTDIVAAATNKASYTYVNYRTTVSLGITASFATFYKDKLWVGTYDELKSTNLYSYTIQNKDTLPTLTRVNTMVMPTRVQGIAFSQKGTMFVSRSCQLYKGLRGYMRQIDVYKPAYSKTVKGVIPLGEPINIVSMPSMNEGIAIDGDYLYVTFESAAFDKASYKMDMITAFRATNVALKNVTEEEVITNLKK